RESLHSARPYLVLQADEPYCDRRRGRRQRRPVHQSFLPAQLLCSHPGRHDLDPRRPTDPPRRGADLSLPHRRRRPHQVPLSSWLSGTPVTGRGRPAVFYLHGFASSAQSTKGTYLTESLAEHGIAIVCPDSHEPDLTTVN